VVRWTEAHILLRTVGVTAFDQANWSLAACCRADLCSPGARGRAAVVSEDQAIRIANDQTRAGAPAGRPW